MNNRLEVEGLSKSFGGVTALSDFDLTVGDNELLCIIGPNGCGKTTFFNLVSGFLAPSSGTICFRGQALAGLAPHKISQLGIGRKFQVPSVYDDMSVRDNLAVAEFARAGRRGLWGLLDQSEYGGMAVQDVLDLIGLSGMRDMNAGHLSHGQKQWLEIGLVLCAGPKLILLDEPTAGMTRQETQKTSELITRLCETNISVILIDHDMWFVEDLNCRVAVMMEGRIIADGSYDDVQAMDSVKEAYLGTSAA